METPERSKTNQIAASVGKYEDSPIFKFINNLSPIKPVKSMNISQAIIPLNFASIPSVFASPHLNSLGGSTILQRHLPSKLEFDAQEDNIKSRDSEGDLAGEMSFDCSEFVVDFSEDSSSVRKIECEKIDMFCSVMDSSSRNDAYRSEIDMEGKNLFEPRNDIDSYKKPIGRGSSFYTSIQNEMHRIQSLCKPAPNEQETSVNNPVEEKVFEDPSGLYRGTRQRCLVFEMGGTFRKHVEENFCTDSSLMLQSGIGLHLNALATNPRIISHDSSNPGQLFIGPNSSVNFHFFSPGNTVLLNSNLDEENGNAIVPVEDPSRSSCAD